MAELTLSESGRLEDQFGGPVRARLSWRVLLDVYYGLNICGSPEFIYGNLITNVMVLRGGAFWK
jgi:hypothetical protein